MDNNKDFVFNAYNKIVNYIYIAVEIVTKIVFQQAAIEKIERNEYSVKKHLSVSGDGFWAKREFFSFIGVKSVIRKHSGKLILL